MGSVTSMCTGGPQNLNNASGGAKRSPGPGSSSGLSVGGEVSSKKDSQSSRPSSIDALTSAKQRLEAQQAGLMVEVQKRTSSDALGSTPRGGSLSGLAGLRHMFRDKDLTSLIKAWALVCTFTFLIYLFMMSYDQRQHLWTVCMEFVRLGGVCLIVWLAYFWHYRHETARTLAKEAKAQPSAQWLNEMLQGMWPHISAFVHKKLKETVEPLLQDKIYSGVHFSQIDFGQKALSFHKIETTSKKRDSSDGSLTMIRLALDMQYRGDAHISLSVSPASLGISDITLCGTLVLDIPELVNRPPFFTGMGIYFANRPTLSMDWRGIADVLDLPVVKGKINETLVSLISSSLVLPNRLAVTTSSGEVFRYKKPRPEGLMCVTIVRASNLVDADIHLIHENSSDPYVRLIVGAEESETQVIESTLNPEWPDGSEEHEFLLYDVDDQRLDLEVYDKDLTSSTLLGSASVPFAKLCDSECKREVWLQLSSPGGEAQTRGSKLCIRTEWRALRIDPVAAGALKPPAALPKTGRKEQVPKRRGPIGAVSLRGGNGRSRATCLVFTGVRDCVGVPLAPPGFSHQVKVSIGAHSFSTHAVESHQADPQADPAHVRQERRSQQKAISSRIKKLLEKEVSDPNVIAEILQCCPETVKAYIQDHKSDLKNAEQSQASEDSPTAPSPMGGRQRLRSAAFLRHQATKKLSVDRADTISSSFADGGVFLVEDPGSACVTFNVLCKPPKGSKDPETTVGTATYEIRALLQAEKNTVNVALPLDPPGPGDAHVDVCIQLQVLMSDKRPALFGRCSGPSATQ